MSMGIHERIIALLKAHPDGLTMGEIREKLDIPASEQAQLDRRKRDLHKRYEFKIRRVGRESRHVLIGPRDKPLAAKAVSGKLRAEVLAAAHGRCGMCGKSVDKHGVTLVVDHRIPQAWGGESDRGNLWAICEECNGGKKAHFASQDQGVMREVMKYKTSHERIAATFKVFGSSAVPSSLLEIVGDEIDWRKRLRELRYVGWEITHEREKSLSRRIKVTWTATKQGEFFSGMAKKIRKIERDRNALKKTKSTKKT
jgi:5-methylcytosine-specific restriction endonuclease McrA